MSKLWKGCPNLGTLPYVANSFPSKTFQIVYFFSSFKAYLISSCCTFLNYLFTRFDNDMKMNISSTWNCINSKNKTSLCNLYMHDIFAKISVSCPLPSCSQQVELMKNVKSCE